MGFFACLFVVVVFCFYVSTHQIITEHLTRSGTVPVGTGHVMWAGQKWCWPEVR